MKILVTRPEPFASELVLRLRKLGKFAWALPLITFIPGRDLEALPQQLAILKPGDLIFLMSQQVIHFANPILQKSKIDWPKFLFYYTIGRFTALRVHTISDIKVDYPITQETSEELIRLHSLQHVSGKRALILRGNSGRELLAKTLIIRGAEVHYCECYQRCIKHYNSLLEGYRWRDRGITTLIVTSGEMLIQLFTLFSPINLRDWLLSCQLLVVSDRLAIKAAKLGWQNIAVANSANNDDLLNKLCSL